MSSYCNDDIHKQLKHISIPMCPDCKVLLHVTRLRWKCCANESTIIDKTGFPVCINCGVVRLDKPTFVDDYNDFSNCRVKRKCIKYDIKFHLSEVFYRLQAAEKNVPNDQFIQELREKLKGDYSFDAIYDACRANIRKHIVFIWCKLNNKPQLIILPQHKEHILNIIRKLHKNIQGRLPPYLDMISLICEKYNLNYIKPYIYTKNKSRKFRDKLYEHI